MARHDPPPTSDYVLVADDDPVWQELLRDPLIACGFSVLEARSGSEALDMLRAHAAVVQGIVIDVRLPEIDGLALAGRIRSDPSIPTVPIVIVSAHKLDELLESFGPMSLGAFDVLDKSGGPRRVAGALKLAVEATRAVSEAKP